MNNNAETKHSDKKIIYGIDSGKQIDHPCMSHIAHNQVARLHLPVAPKCNIKCKYCERSVCPSNINEICPGLAEKIFTPIEALIKAHSFIDKWGGGSIVGVSGPGEPLANSESILTLKLIRKVYPDIKLCLCTNGLTLPEHMGDIFDLNIKHLSITINAIDPKITSKIYSWVKKDGIRYDGEEGARILLENQLQGIQMAIEKGIIVKINSVVIPGINDHHIKEISKKVAQMGCRIHNLMPLISRGDFSHILSPSEALMDSLRNESKPFINVFGKCTQCRADAEGIPGSKCS